MGPGLAGMRVYSSLAGGISYESFEADHLMGGFLSLPMNYLTPSGTMGFDWQPGQARIGDQMRAYFRQEGGPYIEGMVFANHNGMLHLYFRHSEWPMDVWCLYELAQRDPTQ